MALARWRNFQIEIRLNWFGYVMGAHGQRGNDFKMCGHGQFLTGNEIKNFINKLGLEE